MIDVSFLAHDNYRIDVMAYNLFVRPEQQIVQLVVSKDDAVKLVDNMSGKLGECYSGRCTVSVPIDRIATLGAL